MNPRQACLACLDREPVALLEATLWIAAEHDRTVDPAASLAQVHDLQREISANLPMLPLHELAQPLLRQLNALGFAQDEYHPLRPQVALMDKVLQRRRGQPLTLAILARTGATPIDPSGGRELPRPLPAACARGRPFARSLWRATVVPRRLPRTAGPPVRSPYAVERRAHAQRCPHADAPAPVAQPATSAQQQRKRPGRLDRRRTGDATRPGTGKRLPGPRHALPAPDCPRPSAMTWSTPCC